MSSDESNHQKILGFLSGELSKKDDRQCLSIELEYSPPGFRADMLRKWERADAPQYFEEIIFIEQLVAQIVEIAEADADASGTGARAYTVRTRQHMGQRMTCKFRCAPSYESSDQAMVAAGGIQPAPSTGGSHDQAMQILSGNNRDLMRVNQAMYRDTFGTLADLSAQMRDDNIKLRAENIVLRRELEDAKSTKEEKELDIALRIEKSQQQSLVTTKLLNIGTAIAARVMAGDTSKGGTGDPAPVMMLLNDFIKSLTRDQMGKVFGLMRPEQHVLLINLMELAVPKEQGAEEKKAAGG